MSDNRPIGILDSGLGGLTVAREVFRLMPHEKIIYLGDNARAPYGHRSETVIRRYGVQCAKHLIDQDIKMLIVACNTITSVALEQIEECARDLPSIGVVLPGARAAVLRTAEKKIGVIGTKATIRTGAYTKAIQSIGSDIRVFERESPLFVPLVEEGLLDRDVTRSAAQHYLYELIDLGVDCMILGCSHYSLLMEVIQGTVGTRIQLLDSALWTAKEAQDILTALKILTASKDDGKADSRFLFTDNIDQMERRVSLFFGSKLTSVEYVNFGDM
jgi:glutamate racemase